MLELCGVSAGYGKKEVLHEVSVCFAPGKLTAVIGPNGSGKSTLLKTALGILSAARGEIRLNGANLSALDRAAIARQIAYLAQGKAIPDMTVEQMVLHGRFPHLRYPRRYSDRDREIAADAIRHMGLQDVAHMPLAALSGGMRQTAYIAMALVQQTEYILLDEPTTYLDIAHQIDLMRMLRDLIAQGKGVAAVMHDLPLALNFSDSLVVVGDGQVMLCGTPEEVFASGILERCFGVSLERTAEGNYCYRYGHM